MDLKVVSGNTIELPANFFSGDDPADPASPRVDIVDPSGSVVLSNGVPVREHKGIYRFDYAVPASAPTGTWEAIWNATIDGTSFSASDLFEVRPAPAKAPVPPAAGPSEKPEVTPAAASSPSTPAGGNIGAGSSRKRRASGDTDQAVPRRRLSGRKVLLIIGALAIVLAAIWFSPRRPDTDQAKIEQGVAAQKAGRTGEAQELYEDVLQNDPANKLANFNLGVAAQVAGDTERAESLYVKSLQADPAFLPALFNLAILQERAGRNEESEETYRRLLEEYPDNGPAHLNYGFLLAQKMNRIDEGRSEFSKAVEIDPGLAARIPADLRPAPAPAS